MDINDLLLQAPSQTFLINAFSLLLLALGITTPTLSALTLSDLSKHLDPNTPIFVTTPACQGPSCPSTQRDHCQDGAGKEIGGRPGEQVCWVTVDARIRLGVTVAIIVAAGVGIVMAGMGVWGWRRVGGRTTVRTKASVNAKGGLGEREANIAAAKKLALILMVLSVCHLVGQVALLVYSFVVEYQRANRHFSFDESFSDNAVFRGPYTTEGWMCGLKKYNERMEEGSQSQSGGLAWTERGCLMAKAARWGLVPMTVCALVLMLAGVWRYGRLRQGSGMEKEERELRGIGSSSRL
ncbi:hypothetical protein P154DRAFT_614470 [Amniculicola lignicola CBS 123094]|uniref:Uncharacterized protein n=1 Tax=Amniculicola lignicola CBS 123094 TaxID=1392246 RepID=A0A6A5X543_9PLEO|nr:hypothetical protein P154DRAFT_614470 [Amniculicola lignicola CBS 123094]